MRSTHESKLPSPRMSEVVSVAQTTSIGPIRVCVVMLVFGVVLLSSSIAFAQQRRFALLIGHNLGEPGEEELKYAERDAERVAEVLVRYGGFAEEDLFLLRGVSARTIRARLEDLEARITRASESGEDVLLLFYYSGHADPNTMHLGGTKLPFTEMLGWLNGMEVPVRIAIVDACRSGALTRSKGAGPAKPFRIEEVEKSGSEGTVIIASAGENEDAHESERLRGSFFTHYLIAGLAGAADTSSDGRVTLSEAYLYAYSETLRSTSQLQQVQHANRRIDDFNGRQDVILSRLDISRGDGRLALDAAGQYFIFRGDARGELVTEFTATQKMLLMLPPGRYFMRRRVEDRLYEGQFRIQGKETTRMRAADLQQVSYRQVARKGATLEEEASHYASNSIRLGALVRRSPTAGFSPMLGAHLGILRERRRWSFGLAADIEQTDATNAFVEATQRLFALELEAAYARDVGKFTLSMGPQLAGALISQTFVTDGDAPARIGVGARVGARGRVLYNLTPRLAPYVSVDGNLWFYPDAQVQLSLRPGWATHLGLAFSFGGR